MLVACPALMNLTHKLLQANASNSLGFAMVCYDSEMEKLHNDTVIVIGGGLAGCEAAWQLAERGVRVRLYEMRPGLSTPAHHSDDLAELVCSNSLKSLALPSAAATLKHELAAMGSFVLKEALDSSVAAGMALAVERSAFSAAVTLKIASHPLIELVREEQAQLKALLDDPRVKQIIVATGPLTSDALASDIACLLGSKYLSFFDAAAPIVEATSLDMQKLVSQSRYDKGKGEYLNAMLDKEQYLALVEGLVKGERVVLRDFEKRELFSACQPVEEVARSGVDALRYGALKPIGLTNPTTGRRPYAAIQLRAENNEQSAWNLVGFQTNLSFTAQEEVFRQIPGLENASFARYGVMHRNTFIDAPATLGRGFEVPDCPRLRFAGQITGTEGYAEAIASGLYAALNTYVALTGSRSIAGADSRIRVKSSIDSCEVASVKNGIKTTAEVDYEPNQTPEKNILEEALAGTSAKAADQATAAGVEAVAGAKAALLLPAQSTFGALVAYATNKETQRYQPMHVNYGIIPPLSQKTKGKRERYQAYSNRAIRATQDFVRKNACLDFLAPYELPCFDNEEKKVSQSASSDVAGWHELPCIDAEDKKTS